MSEQGFNSQILRFQQILLKTQMFTGALKDSCSEKSEAPNRGFFGKSCSENMQQFYGGTPMLKSNFNKVANLWQIT